MQQSIDFPITRKDIVTLGGALHTHDKYGNGSVSGTLRRILSQDTFLDV